MLAGEALPDAALGQILDRLDREAPGTPRAATGAATGFRPAASGPDLSRGDPDASRDLWAMGWLLDPPADLAERLAWRVLDELLDKTHRLRRALVEAGLAADPGAVGLLGQHGAARVPHLGLTGTDPAAHEAIERRG